MTSRRVARRLTRAHAPSPASKVSSSSPNGLPGAHARELLGAAGGVHAGGELADGRLRARQRELHRGLRRARRRRRRSRRARPRRARRRAAARARGAIGSCAWRSAISSLRAVGEPGVGDRVAAVAVGDRLQHGGPALARARRAAAARPPRARRRGRRRRRARRASGRRRARRHSSGSAEARATEVPMPYSLLTTRKTIGRSHSAARLSDSCQAPMFTAPSPSSQSTACGVPWRTSASASPVATGSWPATMPQPP